MTNSIRFRDSCPVLVCFWCLAVGLVAGDQPEKHAADPAQTNLERKSIVVLGDSLAAGYGLAVWEAFPGGTE
jgi:hypothetical protein